MESLKLSLVILFHPEEAFDYMKRDRSKFSYLPVIVLLFLMLAARAGAIYITHFPLAKIQPRDANLVLETVKMLLPVLTWVIASYAMTTILDGESLLRETLLATSYCLLPYIIFTVPLAFFSQLMDKSQAKLYNGFQIAIIAWVIILIFLSVKNMNKYSVKKTIVISLLGVITMALVWATSALFFAITSQFFDFVTEVLIEFRMKLMG